MNSRWQANKIGLMNFWYYDEQEFPFVKGRILLRGSNGSGKSVTMQSVIPLLLDGNMSPERLDPFGSRDRKMSSYLLEEEDSRQERTGYLYLEFRRRESSTYITIGMGIRARRGKPLDKWYFSLTDGRRIGKDFFLYKEAGEKVPLSKRELEYRIQNGGAVFDRQMDYMEFVNRQIFGFETVEEYKEMVDLLIQLRTPKLSKDFKPTVIHDILSDSLQPLSDEDLRPMSEAIENMDTMNLNLKTRQEAKQAAEKINKIFDRYNRLILFEKASQYDENQKTLNFLEKEEETRKQKKQLCEQRLEQLEAEKNELDAKKAAMENEKESLSKSDAVELKRRELDLKDRIKDRTDELQKKEKRLSDKKDQYLEIEEKQKECQDREYQKERELKELLEDMGAEADEMAFEEHGFFAMELQDQFQSPFSFDIHQKQMEKTEKGIKEGLSLLQNVKTQQEQAELLLKKREKLQRDMDFRQRRIAEMQDLLIQVENEWKEKLYRWNGNNQELILPAELVKELSRFADEYKEESDFLMVRQKVIEIKMEKKGDLDSLIRQKNEQIFLAKEEYEKQKQELFEWENHKEPEPVRSDSVIKNRERLKKMGIPYDEFYRLIEFGDMLEPKECDRLEEALLHMGILDALVIDEDYKEQVLSMDPGCSDRYLFAKKERAKQSILDVLDFNEGVKDIFTNQTMTNILQNIAYDEEGGTSISRDGTYQIGILTGTVTGEYEAGLIGVMAREKNRQMKIQACKEQMEACLAGIAMLEEETQILKSRIQMLEQEYGNFPPDEDMKEAIRMLQKIEKELDRLNEEERELDTQLKELTEKLREWKKEALQIANRLYLSCNYETFYRANLAAQQYSRFFFQLKIGHELYLQIRNQAEEWGRRLTDLDFDMEQIRYDMKNTEYGLQKEQMEYKSIEEQLKLTDYEKMKDRLDQCIQWLREYPLKLQQCMEEKGQKEQQIRQIKEQLEQGKEKIKSVTRKNQYLEQCYEQEQNLRYVLMPEELEKDVKKVRDYLEPGCAPMQKESIIRDLNRIYFENRGFLNDYQLTQTELFEELSEQAKPGDPPAKRLDLYARYQGVRIPFGRLLSHLDEEIKELQELIQAGDRELFEDILANTMSRKIRAKINSSNTWIEKMNRLMGSMNTSSGLKLSLRWRSKTAEQEDQLDTKDLVNLLKKDYRLMREEEAERLSRHFRSKVEDARRHAKDSGGMISFYQVMKETLDYRKWFEFQLFYQKSGERQKELTNSAFGTFSGGEKAMSMYVPLFSAVVAKYQGGRKDAPRLISLDEAFAGVDNKNIRDMFRLMTEFQFDFIINSQVLWGDCDTLDALAIYQLIRPENAKFVTVMSYLWNGKSREILEDDRNMEMRAAEISG